MVREICQKQLKYMDEMCIAVDELDKPLRPVSKKDCHWLETSSFCFCFLNLKFSADFR